MTERARPPRDRFGRYAVLLVLCLTLGLAPFSPEPHIVGKLRWVAGGGHAMRVTDVFDLVLPRSAVGVAHRRIRRRPDSPCAPLSFAFWAPWGLPSRSAVASGRSRRTLQNRPRPRKRNRVASTYPATVWSRTWRRPERSSPRDLNTSSHSTPMSGASTRYPTCRRQPVACVTPRSTRNGASPLTLPPGSTPSFRKRSRSPTTAGSA